MRDNMTKFEILDDGQRIALPYVEDCGCQVLCEAGIEDCPTFGATVQRDSYLDSEDTYVHLLYLVFGDVLDDIHYDGGVISISVDTRTCPSLEQVTEWFELHDTMQLTDRYMIRKSAGVPTLL
jgi:hypothetical protein